MYILVNGVIMLAELAAIAAVAWLGFTYPIAFAGLTGLAALALGIVLEARRLENEMPFYFNRPPGRSRLFIAVVGGLEAIVKAILAAVVGLITFLGTDQERLFSVALIFASVLFLGVQGVRFLGERLQARPLRWGYFRLAAPLGLLFSGGLSFLPAPGLSELAKRVAFELPERPNMEQASEFLFLLKQTFDDIVERMLAWVFDPGIAAAISAIVSINMLSGFVLAIYAVIIADGARRMEGST
ncbi:MAG: hypothetical protein ACRCS9_15090 [Hyphomicrobium sp.]